MRLIVLFATMFFINSVSAQNTPFCGFDGYFNELFENHPDLKIKQQEGDRLLYERALSFSGVTRGSSVPYVIPVVVHIVHQNGPENLSDSIVIAAIDELNLRFQNASPYFDASGSDMQIQFCLATVDPHGNPTNGITRTFSNYTYLGQSPNATDWNLKNLIRWEPALYMNVWIIHSMPPGTTAVGYATYPTSAGSSIDGIVVLHNYLNSYVLTHEAGHYLGLRHTFDGGCVNLNCLVDGDMVCDTPPDATADFICPFNSCNTELSDTTGLSPFISDVDDVPNYMDYTTCPLSFTLGQRDRMHDAINIFRSYLLQSNGCGQNPGGTIPAPAFTWTLGCPNMTFSNTSLNSIGASWDFNGDGLIDASGNVVSYNFPATGFYDVTIYASGFGGIDTLTQTIFAQVRPYQNYPLKSTSGIVLSLIEQGWAVCSGSSVTLTGEPGMVSYNWSTGDTTESISFTPVNPFSINLTCVDSAGLIWPTCAPASAVMVPATTPPVLTILGNDTVFCYDDWGETFTIVANFSPLMLFNTWFGPTTVIPGFHDSVLVHTITGMYNTFFVNQTDSNGCSSTSNILNMNLEYHAQVFPITQSGDTLFYHNSISNYEWYFNGVPIPGSNSISYVMTQTGCYTVYGWYSKYDCGTFASDSVCFVVSSIAEQHNEHEILVYPNQTTGKIHFTNLKQNDLIGIYDLAGKRIEDMKVDMSNVIFEMDLSQKLAGIYLIRISRNGFPVFTDKLIRVND